MNQKLEMCILVIDDEVGVTRLCERFLTRVGYQVLKTNYPKEAVKFLR